MNVAAGDTVRFHVEPGKPVRTGRVVAVDGDVIAVETTNSTYRARSMGSTTVWKVPASAVTSVVERYAAPEMNATDQANIDRIERGSE